MASNETLVKIGLGEQTAATTVERDPNGLGAGTAGGFGDLTAQF